MIGAKEMAGSGHDDNDQQNIMAILSSITLPTCIRASHLAMAYALEQGRAISISETSP